ncbi:MAG: hypothetical protein LLF89_00465 [Spirochaetaceae bacterium]|nr:hypothetical protein [Spirochaetaceae bacterium]
MPSKNDIESGKLKIGDNWNVISIIALSQNNPLKAMARDRAGRMVEARSLSLSSTTPTRILSTLRVSP